MTTPTTLTATSSSAPAGNLNEAAHNASVKPAHSQTTRVLHLILLLCVVYQLVGSQFTSRPIAGAPLDLITALHEYAGLGTMVVVGAFWVWTLVRRRETPLGKLFPWFSARRLGDVLADIKGQFRSLLRREIPSDADGASAGAIHGLGILTVTFMTATGTAYFFLDGTLARSFLSLHRLSANLMWAYLFGHAGLAVLHHLAGSNILSRMFWNQPRAVRPG